ncbi:MAG: hypothetical protein WCG03_00575 [Kiritimatiellales bacterium]
MMEKTVKWLLIALAALHLGMQGTVVKNNFQYSAVKDSSEDIGARIAFQISEGFSGYATNSVHYDMLNYTPLYYNIQAQAIRWIGLDIRIQRFVALFFGAGTVLLIAAIVRLRARNFFWSCLAAAFFAGINLPCWFIELNANLPCFFFAALALFGLMRDPKLSWITCLWVTISLFCSFWSKQTGVAFLAAGLFFILLNNRLKFIVCLLFAGALIGAGVVYYERILKAPFIFNVFGFLSMEPILWNRLLDPILFPQITGRLGVVTALLAAGLFCTTKRWKDVLKPEYIFLGAAAVSGVYASLKYGSGLQHHVLFYGLLITCALLLADQMIKQGVVKPILIYTLLAVQALAEIYDVRPYLINDADQARFEKIQSLLATPGKRTQYYSGGYHSILVGQPSYVVGTMEPEDNYLRHRISYHPNFIKFWDSDPFDLFLINVPLEANSQLAAQYLQRDFQLVGELPEIQANSWEPRKRLLIFERKRK